MGPPPAPAATIRPDVRYIWCGPCQLIVEPNGSAGSHPLTGLFFRQARFLKTLQLRINGEPPHLCSVAEVSPRELEFAYIFPEVDRGGGGGTGSGRLDTRYGILCRSLDIFVRCRMHPASARITLEITNRWQDNLEIDIAWLLSADYATIDDAQFDQAQSGCDVQRSATPSGVVFRSAHPSLPFETHVSADTAQWNEERSALTTRIALPKQQVVRHTLTIRAHDPNAPIDEAGEELRESRLRQWYANLPRLYAAGEPALVEYTARALIDLGNFSLLEGAEDEWLTPAAGAPIYHSLWGRDALTAGWQAGFLDRGDMLADVLNRLSRLQGTTVDPDRDEEPGRIIDQAKSDPDSRLGLSPFGRYYADIASPFMFILGLGYSYALTGDRRQLERHWPAAMRVLEWADSYGDRDGDGYIEYLTQSPVGPTHQAWKDSENAVVDNDGRAVEPPIAACEIQGYWHIALQFMAVLAFARGDQKHARRLWRQAADLRDQFNRDFWMNDERCIAFGLDADKRPIRAITSNAGQCLPTGIVKRRHMPHLVQRLFEPDMFNGWGIRTLSTRNPAYNPLDYHLGSVWPVENATILFGLRRYGFNDRGSQLTRALYDLARLWPSGRLPECVGGYAREDAHHPGAYPRANAPQTWNQSIWPILVQSLIGAVPYAPLRLLLIDPNLPTWLPDLTIQNLRVGDASVSLHFWRENNGHSKFEILERRGRVRVVRQPWIESGSAGMWGRLSAIMDSLF